MNRMMVAVFPTDAAAHEGLNALEELHARGDITVYSTAVLVKDASGAMRVAQAADPGPVGTAVGMLTGSLVGLLAGPLGAAVGLTTGGAAGLVFDLADLGIGASFLDDVSRALGPGKAALVAEVEETWTTPVDTRLGQLGATVFRRLRAEVVEQQVLNESEAFTTEMKQLRDELARATAETRAAVARDVSAGKARLAATLAHARSRAEQVQREMEAKLTALDEQITRAGDASRARIQARLAAVQAEYAARSAKVAQAGTLIKEALVP